MIRITELTLRRAELHTRMPFRYGIATMTALPHVFLTATLETPHGGATGIAADHLPPKWFTKDPTRDPQDEIGDMLLVIRQAARFARELSAPTPFALWRELHHAQAAWAAAEKIPPLLAHFGTSLVERAVLDAWARSQRQPLHRLLHADPLGLDLGAIHPELAGTAAREWLPAYPLSHAIVRHTVGLSDPLTRDDIAAADILDDGLPQSLDDCIRAYGLKHFKIKLCGRHDHDLERLQRIAALLARHAPPDYACTVDGNEGFPSADALRAFLHIAGSHPALADFWPRVFFIEQPIHRDHALCEPLGPVTVGARRLPVIIDESDAGLTSLRTALELGYAGTSHKNCKGVFKGIAHACRLAQLGRARPDAGFLMSAEDLTNIGPVALLQDLAVQALLGNASIERNGHHYFAGLSAWPPHIQQSQLAEHDDLYTTGPAGWPTLRIVDGRLSLASINAAPFGLHSLPDLTGCTEHVVL